MCPNLGVHTSLELWPWKASGSSGWDGCGGGGGGGGGGKSKIQK